MGIDPGSHRLGWGVVEKHGSRLTHVASGTLQAPADQLGPRLRALADGLDEVIDAHAPAVAAVESVFFAHNSQSALVLGQARGAALVCLARRELAIFEYTPGQTKQATTGRGRADKQQVQAMVCMLLGLGRDVPMAADTSDALAAAICHLQSHAGATPGGVRR